MEHGLDSIHNQHDPGMRTIDFFDDTSDTTSEAPKSAGFSHTAENGDSGERRLSSTGTGMSQNEDTVSNALAQFPETPKHSSRDSRLHPFLRLTSGYGTHHGRSSVFEDTKPSHTSSGDVPSTAQSQHLPLQNSDTGPIIHHGRSSKVSPTLDENVRETSFSTKNDRILGAHAITMRALLHDEDFGRDIMSPLTEEPRVSNLFASLGDRLEEKPDSLKVHRRQRSESAPARKRVSLVPPPINIHSPGHALPENIVRTPYPFHKHKPSTHLRHDSVVKPSPTQSDHPPNRSSHHDTNPNSSRDTVDCTLTLSLQRANPTRAPLRISHLTIPSTANDFRSVRNSTLDVREKHFDGLAFDDAELFRHLRNEYAKLAGPWRFLSARVLTRVAVIAGGVVSPHNSTNMQQHETSGTRGSWVAGHQNNRPIPRLRPSHPTDPFTEVEFLRHLHSPAVGSARYGWVHWARKVATSSANPISLHHHHYRSSSTSSYEPFEPHRPPPPPPQRQSASWPLSEEGDVGLESEAQWDSTRLEFVTSWGVRRIASAMLGVVMLAIAAAVVWILVGLPRKDLGTLPGYGDEGFRDAGGRVSTGCLLGLLVLILGWTGVGGWIWVSWAMM